MENKEGQKHKISPPSPSTPPPPMRKSKPAKIGEKQQQSVISSSSTASCATYNISSSCSSASCATYTVPPHSTINANNSTNSSGLSKTGTNNNKSTINNKKISKSNKSALGTSATMINGGADGTGSSKSPSGESKADTEEDDDDQQGPGGGAGSLCECVQCEVCMAENWWRMAALQNSLLQQQGGSPPGLEFSENATSGLDLIGSAASLMLSQQRASTANEDGSMATADDMFRADFSMPKLLEFFESQKSMGIPNFPEDFDEFWLLVVKARLFNIFKYRGPEAYNRVVYKIRNIVHEFREELDVRERQKAAAAAMTAIIKGKEPKMPTTDEIVAKDKNGGEEKTNKMAAGNGNNKANTTKKQPKKAHNSGLGSAC